MNVCLLLIRVLLAALPGVALAAPSEEGYYRYWGEPDAVAYAAAGADFYEVSGKYAAVMTYEENPRTGQYAMIGELFDCADSYYALAERIDYGADGLDLRHYSNDNVKKSFKPVEEDTRQEFLVIGVCSEETRLPYDLGAMRKYFKMIDASLRALDN
ncbi:MAG TPA: hypothetical protein VLA15_08375 [Desulfurivibrionaceae bacterium]|nr:hypothetical protein [Desulfurivibrionaceae bacterium]